MGIMKRWKRWEVLGLVAIIVTQSVIYWLAGMSKAYFHMDEIYSYSLSNHERVQIYEGEDYYDQWHTPEYYNDYLTVGEDERGDFRAVYENQKNDVHPPVFYLLMRLGMELMPGKFSKWTGIGLNMIIAAVDTVVVFLVVKEIFGQKKSLREERRGIWLHLGVTAVVALMLATVSTVIYIRMYELLTLWIGVMTLLHLKLLRAEGEKRIKLLVGIGGTELLGGLTQYYFWFYLAALAGYFVVRYGRTKKWRELGQYVGTVMGAGVVSLVIWPHAITHMFFGYRGQGVLSTLLDPGKLLGNLWQYARVVDEFVFHGWLLMVVAVVIGLAWMAVLRRRQLDAEQGQRERILMMLVPTGFYLVIVAAASPFVALRYIAPVCGSVLMLTVWLLYELGGSFGEKTRRAVLGVGLAGMVVGPMVFGTKPDVVYTERAVLVEKAQERREAPALYLMKTGEDWAIMNDILLMREFEESYIAQDVGADKEKIREILKGKDLSEGLVVFINDGQENAAVLEAVEAVTGLELVDTERIVMSDMYYLK